MVAPARGAATPRLEVLVRIRSAAPLVAFLAMLAVTPTALAQNVMLEADRGCYRAGQVITLTGYGFTPDGDVALSAEGQQLGIGLADYDGIFSASLRAPSIPFAALGLRFTATDQTYLLNRATTVVRLTSLGVLVTPPTGDPARVRRIRARGFFGGRALYAHIRRGDRARTMRVGRLRGACRTLNVKRRLFPRTVDPGSYTLRFDTNRRPAQPAGPSVTYAVRIAARGGRARATAAMVPPATDERGPLEAAHRRTARSDPHGARGAGPR